jgi:hypothetical protein
MQSCARIGRFCVLVMAMAKWPPAALADSSHRRNTGH